jgi:hypothetical protein
LKSIAKHEEVVKEEAAVKSVGALKKRHRDWHLDVGCRGQPKKWIQGNGESRKKLAVACRRMTSYAIPARRKGHCCHGQGKKKAVSRTQKRRTFRKRRRAKPESISGSGTEILRSSYISRKTDNREQHQRTKQEIKSSPGKAEYIIWDPRMNCRNGGRETSRWDFH